MILMVFLMTAPALDDESLSPRKKETQFSISVYFYCEGSAKCLFSQIVNVQFNYVDE